jgi:predicted ester cyclase
MRRSAVLILTLVIVLGGVVVSGPTLLAQDATPADCPTATPDEIKALMQQYFDDQNARSSENVEEMLHDSYTEHNSAFPYTHVEGNDDEIVFFEGDPNYDFTIEVLDMVVEGDLVATRVQSTGTYHNDEVEGYPEEGRPVQYESHAFWRIECGQIAEGWIVTDIYTIRRQEGRISDEEVNTADEVPAVATPDLE